MSDRGDAAIGLDLGTSGLKAVAVDAGGVVVGRARASYPTARPEPDAAEQDPADWLRAADTALAELAERVEPARWAAIGLSAMLPTLVSLDASGAPIGPAITWEDGRAEEDGERIASRVGPAALYRTTGQRFDGRYLLAMHARRLREGLPVEATAAGAKDYLFRELTGDLLTDPSTAAGYGAYGLESGRWERSILAAAGVERVPEVAPSSTVRPLREAAASRWGCRAGIPVVLGAADSVLGAYGLGVRGPGSVACIAGTSTVLLAWAPSSLADPEGRYLVTPLADGGYGLELDLMATGSALDWLAGLLGLDGPAALAGLAEEATLAEAPLVLPYLAPGEQGALWDPRLFGAVEGLTLRTTRAGLARGLFAGIVLESRRCLAALADATERADGPVVLSGSGAASAVFRQDLADATGRRVVFRPGERDHSALGAAWFAGSAALGWAVPEGDAGDAADAGDAVIAEPDPARASAWAERFERHEAARLAQRALRH